MTRPFDNAVPRLSDVAREAGVSRMAAAHVINGTGGATVRVSAATRQRIVAAAERLNYRPNRIAQQLRGARSHVLGVIYDTWNLTVMSARLAALDRHAAQQGYRLMIGQVHGDPAGIQEYLADFRSYGAEGIICLFDLLQGHERTLRPLFDRQQRVVFYGQRLVEHAGCVRVDTADAVRQVVAHLRERGRQRPALLLWNAADPRSILRRQGFLAELKTQKLPLDKERFWSAESGPENPSPETLDQAIDALVQQQGADALITDDDVWAVRLIQRLKQRGYRVPDDVAVVGYDNLELSTVIDPALTTVDQNHEACAEALLRLLREMLEQEEPASMGREITIPPKLIVRQST